MNPITRSLKSDRGIVLITFYLFIVVLAIGLGALAALALADFRGSLYNQYSLQAFYLAEAGVDQKMYELSQGNKNNIGSTALGNGTYQATYSETNNIPAVASTGTVNNISRVVTVTLQKSPSVTANAAVFVNGVASTSGSITIDGRNHTEDGTLIAGDPGKPGISTTEPTFSQGGSSKIGGNGYAPTSPANPGAVQVNAPPVPTTPEGVLGLSAGALDQYKTSVPPATPFQGIVYLTTSWTAPDFDGGVAGGYSSGILIVHNASNAAFLKNLHGEFRGLIITDDIIHINGDALINGALIGLKQTGITLGNGNAQVNYSSQALSNLQIAKYTVLSWQDAQNA